MVVRKQTLLESAMGGKQTSAAEPIKFRLAPGAVIGVQPQSRLSKLPPCACFAHNRHSGKSDRRLADCQNLTAWSDVRTVSPVRAGEGGAARNAVWTGSRLRG